MLNQKKNFQYEIQNFNLVDSLCTRGKKRGGTISKIKQFIFKKKNAEKKECYKI